MTGDEAAEPGSPRTLRHAHDALARSRPRLQAPLGEWLAYYQRAAAWYAEMIGVTITRRCIWRNRRRTA